MVKFLEYCYENISRFVSGIMIVVQKKLLPFGKERMFIEVRLAGIEPVEALAAVDGLVATRLERYFGGNTAAITNCVIHGTFCVTL